MVGGLRLGVDLGTSNTAAVLRWPDGRCRPLLFDGSPQMPSAVYAAPGGDMVVGRDAVQHSRVHPDRFERNPKRRVDDGTVLLGDVELPVVELMAAVLRRVHTEAARVGGRQIAEAVLTHPVEWGAQRRAMLANAAARAGLHNARLVPEPVAAASYFIAVLRNQLPIGRNLVVYDFGAGTFDATVVRRTPDNLQVLSTDGVADAGGLDVDAAVVEYLGEVFAERDPDGWKRLINPHSAAERRMSQQFWEDVRGAKEMLSRAPSAIVHVPVVDVDVPVGREQLEKFARPVLDRTLLATQSAIRTAAVNVDGIAGVFLVGGSSRIPLVATLLHRALQIAPTTLEQPEMVVAEGSLYVPAAALAIVDPRGYAAPVSGPPGSNAPMSGPPGPIAPMSGPPAGPIAPMSGPPMSGPPASGPPYRPGPQPQPVHRPGPPVPQQYRPGPPGPYRPAAPPVQPPQAHPQQPSAPYRPIPPQQHLPRPQQQGPHQPGPQRPMMPPPHPQQQRPVGPPQHPAPQQLAPQQPSGPQRPAPQHPTQQHPVQPHHPTQQRPIGPPPAHQQPPRPTPAYPPQQPPRPGPPVPQHPQHPQQHRPGPPPQHTQQHHTQQQHTQPHHTQPHHTQPHHAQPYHPQQRPVGPAPNHQQPQRPGPPPAAYQQPQPRPGMPPAAPMNAPGYPAQQQGHPPAQGAAGQLAPPAYPAHIPPPQPQQVVRPGPAPHTSTHMAPLVPTPTSPLTRTPAPVHAPPPGGRREPLPMHPLAITLPAGTAYSLAATAQRTDFLVADARLLAVRSPDRLATLLREQPSLTVSYPWAALPSDLRPGELDPTTDGSFDFVGIGRILAAASEADPMPMHRGADGPTAVEPDHTGHFAPAEITRHVELVRRLLAVLRRRSLVLDTERIRRTSGPLLAVGGAGRLDAAVLRAGVDPGDRFRAAIWWWQMVDELTVVTDWR